MKHKEPSVRSVLMVSLISGAAGFINGVWVILAGTSYFYTRSPYSWILGALLFVIPVRVIDRAEDFLFRSGLQLILAPLLGVFWGAVIGFVASRFSEKPATSFWMKTGAIRGGIGGFVSLSIIFLNIYAS
jgi:hypothetical protein